MRLLDENLSRSATRELLDTIMIQRWNMNKIEESECRKSMPETDEIYLSHALHSLGVMVDNSDQASRGKVWSLDKTKVAKATAHILFQNQKNISNIWAVDDFLLEWSSRIPDTVVDGEDRDRDRGASSFITAPDEDLLAGIAIQVENGYRYAPASQINLLSKAEERFKHLASIKLKYKQEEIGPYCTGLYASAGQPRSIPELLLKHSKFVDGMYILKT